MNSNMCIFSQYKILGVDHEEPSRRCRVVDMKAVGVKAACGCEGCRSRTVGMKAAGPGLWV